MGYLKDLSVNKVSFVKRGANRRTFLLLKSDELPGRRNTTKQGEDEMKDLVKEKIREILKSETVASKVLETLKADSDLKLTDEEIQEIEKSLEFLPDVVKAAPTPEPTPAPAPAPSPTSATPTEAEIALSKTLESLETIQKAQAKQISDQQDKINKHEADAAKASITRFLNVECAYLSEDTEVVSEELLTLEKASPKAFELMKSQLQRTSLLLSKSVILGEIGNGAPGSIPKGIGQEIMTDVRKVLEEVQKTGDAFNAVDVIRGVVVSKGRDAYETYRHNHNRRAKLAGLENELGL